MSRLTLRQKVAQLVVIPFYGQAPKPRTRESRDLMRLVRKTGVGGLIVINRAQGGVIRKAEPVAMAAFLNRMQKAARLPLLVGGDFERGASMRVTDSTKYPHAMAYTAAGDIDAVRRLGAATAREARAMGVQWIFAPDADVNNAPENPIINIRSFGEDPQSVSEYVRAFIEGAHSLRGGPVLTTVKHFPGHGDTSIDSHIGLPRLEASKDRIENVELVPFRAAIEGGVDAVMTAHMAVPALDRGEQPATVSSAILTGLLRKELDFRGLVVTDAMDMQGLALQLSPGDAAVRAIEAGADVLLMPPKPDVAINAVVKAVESGRISRKRIDESVRRVLSAKVKVGLNRNRLVNLETISDTIDTDESEADAQEVTDRAVTLVKNESNLVPLSRPENACYFVLTENHYGEQGKSLADELSQRVPQANVRLFDPDDALVELREAAESASHCETLVVFAFVSVGAYRGDVALPGDYPEFMRMLQASGKRVVLVSLGSPYLLATFPGVSAYFTTYTPVETAEVSAVKALLGEIPIRGSLPVSIPGIAQIGAGIQTAVAGHQTP